MTEQDVVDSFKGSIGDFPRKSEYSQVHALLIAWSENDIGPENEIQSLRSVLEKDYNYNVSTFAIPTDGTQSQCLNLEIASFVNQWSKRTDSLVIIYYAGHCSADKDGKAEWSAYEEGGPTITWHVAQQLLFSALGDVLLILDCCNASLITKGSKDTGRFELLAASAKGVKTPVPGKWSFTSALVRELKKSSIEGVFADKLCSSLREDHKITETPVFHDFARQELTKIYLRRMELPESKDYIKKPVSYVLLRASLSDDLTGREIANWLKTAPPKHVTSINIEAIVTKARRLQGNIDSQAFPRGSIFEKLSPGAQNEILQQLQKLNTVMAEAATYAGNPSYTADGEAVQELLTNIHNAVSSVCTAVETPVLLGLTTEEEAPPFDNDLVAATDVDAALLLRKAVLQEEPPQESGNQEIPVESVSFSRNSQRFKVGRTDQQTVIIETYKYRENPDDGNPYLETMQQVRKMAGLLCRPKPGRFRILPCVGFFHDRLHHEIGLAFKPPPTLNADVEFSTLVQLYRAKRIVPLGHRIRLAWTLAMSVENFHRVGWVHKSIRSDNIAFAPHQECLISLEPDESLEQPSSSASLIGSFDLGQPFVFGFEYARASDAGTNLEEDHSQRNNYYRHPDRWGRPAARFEKSHDVYALGIVLIEIAFWKEVERLIKLPRGRVVPTEVRDFLIEECDKKLPHQVGESFARCILTCLNFGPQTHDLDDYERQRYFQQHVVGKIGKSVGRI